jgi:hypothetical protein
MISSWARERQSYFHDRSVWSVDMGLVGYMDFGSSNWNIQAGHYYSRPVRTGLGGSVWWPRSNSTKARASRAWGHLEWKGSWQLLWTCNQPVASFQPSMPPPLKAAYS